MQGGGSTGSFLNFKPITDKWKWVITSYSLEFLKRVKRGVACYDNEQRRKHPKITKFLISINKMLCSFFTMKPSWQIKFFSLVEISYAFKINNADNFCIHSISKRFWSVSQQLTVIMLACLNTLSIFILFLFCVSYWWNISCHVTWK